MRNLKKYSGNCFEFHKEVLQRKQDDNYKNRIHSVNDRIAEHFQDYSAKCEENRLHLLNHGDFTESQKEDLRNLYSYGAKKFRELKKILITMEDGTPQPLCPYCTISNANSFDHFIPQKDFAEFSDNPINLLPCCSDCNSKKSIQWQNSTMGSWLNLYLDKLPDIQYLFVDLSLINETIQVEFYVENRNNVDTTLFQKIFHHYDKLKLCELFKSHSYNIISELKNTLRSYRTMDTEQLRQRTIQNTKENRIRFGYNYWETILKLECCNNVQIFNFLLG